MNYVNNYVGKLGTLEQLRSKRAGFKELCFLKAIIVSVIRIINP